MVQGKSLCLLSQPEILIRPYVLNFNERLAIRRKSLWVIQIHALPCNAL